MYIDERRAIELLNSNDIVALPTETVYGLAARFDSEIALKKVFKTKKRPSFDPLIVHVSHKSQLEKITASVSEAEHFLMDAFWPGPLTLVLSKKANVSDIITSGLDTVAVRMPKNQSFLDIIQQTAPLAAPSANLFGYTSPTLAEHVEFEFSGAVPVFDGGPCAVGIESTVLKIEETDDTLHLYILRPGMLSHHDITKELKDYSEKRSRVHFGATPASPGHIDDHYQPRNPLIVAKQSSTWTTGIHAEICKKLNLPEDTRMLGLAYTNDDPTLVARLLYSDLRRLSSEDKSYIYLTVGNDFFTEEWRGIRDRVQKASKCSVMEENGQFFIHNKLENFQP